MGTYPAVEGQMEGNQAIPNRAPALGQEHADAVGDGDGSMRMGNRDGI
jgi:hypothetical protein